MTVSVAIRRGLAAAFGAWAMLGGCAARPEAEDLLPLGSARPAVGAMEARDVVPWARRGSSGATTMESPREDGSYTTRYEILEGADAGEILVETRRPGPSDGSWLVVRRVESEAGPREERLLVIDESDGSVVMPNMVNHARGVIVEMNPPSIALPGRIEAGRPIARRSAIRLPLIANPRRLRDKGVGESEWTFEAEQRVRTRAGVIEARMLREAFTSRLGSATAVRTTERWYAPGRGLVAERWVEEVSVLGVVIERTRQTIRVLPPGGAAAGSGVAAGPVEGLSGAGQRR